MCLKCWQHFTTQKILDEHSPSCQDKGQKVIMPKAEKAFKTFKNRITTEPVLKMADPDLPFKVETDAFDYALEKQLS